MRPYTATFRSKRLTIFRNDDSCKGFPLRETAPADAKALSLME